MPTLSTAEIRAAARARAKAATEALPELVARYNEADAAHKLAYDAERATHDALAAASDAVNLCSATPAAALALIRLVESAPHLIGALNLCGSDRRVTPDEAAALLRRKLASPPRPGGGRLRLSSLGAQVLRLHAEITAETPTTEDKQ